MTRSTVLRALGQFRTRSLRIVSGRHCYLSGVSGVLIGLLPIAGGHALLGLAVSLGLSLNLALILVGIGLVQLIPLVHLGSHWIAEWFSPSELTPFSSAYLSLAGTTLNPSERAFYLAGCLAMGAILALLLIPISRLLPTAGPERSNALLRAPGPVFRDPSGKRASVLRRFAVHAVPAGLLLLGTFAFALSQDPLLPSIGLAKPEPFAEVQSVPRTLASGSGEQATRSPAGAPGDTDGTTSQRFSGASPDAKAAPGKVFAFYVPWDLNSRISLEQNIEKIDVVIPEWFHLRADLTISDDRQEEVDAYLRKHGVPQQPSISNLIDGKWNREVIRSLITSPTRISVFTEQILTLLDSGPYQGINLDFENLQPSDRHDYTSFVRQLRGSLSARGYQVSVDLSVGEPESYDYPELAAIADHLILMLYDEHYSTGAPGPIASQPWFTKQVEALSGLPADKIVVGLGNYGYDWDLTQKSAATSLTVHDAFEIAREGKLEIVWDAEQHNPHYSYRRGGSLHEVWFLDAATAYNQISTALGAGFPNVAIWVLGSEDQSLWDFIGEGSPGPVRQRSTIRCLEAVRYVGQGEILRVVSTPEAGVRRLTTKDGLIVGETYDALPVPYKVARYGGTERKQVVLTFDDGPDDRHTPQILDILKEHRVPAAFFIVGVNALRHPSLVTRTYREGHEIGIHTFSHPDVRSISDAQYEIELSLSQRILQNLTGRSSLLFRPPSGVDVYNPSPQEFAPALKAQREGYTVVGELIDPKDWKTPSAEKILSNVLDEVANGEVILLHDSGGDRSHTVAALPRIIEELQARGYEFVSVGDLLGKTRADVMPEMQPEESPFILYTQRALNLAGGALGLVNVLFVVATALGLFRFVFLVYFSGRQARRRPGVTSGSGLPTPVSVVIAAFNEEQVICRTVQSVLDSDHPVGEIIIVNDGSTDRTSAVIRERFKDHPQVLLLEQENSGKSAAVNWGFRTASNEIVVAFDADTIVGRQSIGHLVHHFRDPKVGAVSGNIRVGNVHNLLTKWQHIEYVIGFNLERRAFDQLNCVTVVPGAMGAWRKGAVAACGYFPEDTLAEDTDVTLSLLQNGLHVTYEPRAVAFTEAPSDLRSLFKQRTRWTYGTLQCLWKHRRALLSGKHRALGWIALPSMWVFQFGFQLLAPLADLVFLAALAAGQVQTVLLYYGLFLLIDYLAALRAFRLEGENPRVLVWLFLQRIIYRMIIMLVIIKSILMAIRGIPVGWNKLRRKGDVTVDSLIPDGTAQPRRRQPVTT